jgi:NhaP-type Na+/H+ or K+/H+ antiporter
MHQAETIFLLFAAVAALVVVAHKLSLPYPIVLVISGLALSFVPRLPEVKLNPEIVFYFFLPPLLYPAALFTSWRDFRRNLRPILLLAIGLVLVTMVTVAWAAHTIVPGATLGGRFRTWRNCFASRRDRRHGRYPPAFRSVSHRSNSRRRKPGK